MRMSSAARSSSCLAASSDTRRPIAFARFCSWLRSSCDEATSPLGRWMRRTADDVLLMCWPPAPEARKTSIFSSLSGISTSATSASTGYTSTAAKLVCRLALPSNGLMRTRRCVPRSDVISPKAYRPYTVNSADMMPASVPSET